MFAYCPDPESDPGLPVKLDPDIKNLFGADHRTEGLRSTCLLDTLPIGSNRKEFSGIGSRFSLSQKASPHFPCVIVAQSKSTGF